MGWEERRDDREEMKGRDDGRGSMDDYTRTRKKLRVKETKRKRNGRSVATHKECGRGRKSRK